jgi:hypothetical protein
VCLILKELKDHIAKAAFADSALLD